MARQFFIKDKNLKPENIKQGVKILNVTGTYEGGGSGDCEEWPSLLGVNNTQSSTHAGVIFDTGFPIADGYINDYFNGYFSCNYGDSESFFLFGNRSNVNPETGNTYYWGIWIYQDKLIVSFGSLSRGTHNDCAVFTLGPSMNDYDVPMWDLPISWVRTENMDYGSPDDEYGTEYIYEVKVGNIIKYAPAFDDRLEFFDGLNMCVFGRNASESPGGYGAGAPSATKCSRISITSADGEHNAYEMSLEPYVKNGTATLLKHYTDYTAGEETVETLEPILHEGAETNFDNFFIYYDPYQVGIEVAPSTKEQHIDTVSNTDVFPYVTVLPMNLASASETITENGQVVISAGDYGADGISEITLDVSVDAGGGSDWLADALAGNITDLSDYELPGLSGEGRYSYLFANTPIVKTPNINGALDGKHIAYYMFSDCSVLTEADLSNLTSLEGYNMEAGYYMFRNCTNLVSADLSGLVEVRGQYACGYMFYNCTSLESVDLGSLSNIGSYSAGGPFYHMFRNCTNLTDVTIHPKAIERSDSGWNPLETAIYIENLTLSDTASNDIRLKWQPNLTADAVLDVLSNLDLTSSGHSVMFYDNGLTVQDDAQGSIQTAYDDAVDAGWTIYNLTIIPDPGR